MHKGRISMRREPVHPARLKRSSLIRAITLLAAFVGSPSFGADSVDASVLANSKAAARVGKATYLRLCQYCHGADGKALENIDFEATNLTDPSRYRYGIEPAAIFNSIKNGAGDDMLPFKDKLSDEQIWQLVAFVLSIGPEERRPKQE
jgi:mono/diheme cytochrome c family protein